MIALLNSTPVLDEGSDVNSVFGFRWQLVIRVNAMIATTNADILIIYLSCYLFDSRL